MSSVIKVNTLQDAGGNSLLVSNGSGSITTNNINVKDVDWQAVVTSNTTMVAGKGYFVDSSGGTKTMTLPASPSIGDTVAVHTLDGATNAVTVARNSSNIEGATTNITLDSDYAAITLIFSDAANGWVRHNKEVPDSFISATGGTATTSGNYKIHKFTSSSNFVVATIATDGDNNKVSYMVAAGGGGGGGNRGPGGGAGGGGGGAGGFREGKSSVDDYTASPLNAPVGLTISAQTYPITVGAGGAAGPTGPTGSTVSEGAQGGNSVFSTITSAGGGGGFWRNGGSSPSASAGGSGGGGGADDSNTTVAGLGNTPPVSPSQGNNSGITPASAPNYGGSGGGGAGAVGSNGTTTAGGNGGTGVDSSISSVSTGYAGGGGAGVYQTGTAGSGTKGGGTGAANGGTATAGTANTGGGGGGVGTQSPGTPFGTAGAGGSGVVIIRYKYQ